MLNILTRSILLLVALATPASLLGAPPPGKLAFTNAHIITVSGEPISGGTILVESGVITAVGTEVEIPYDAMEVDCTDMVLMPGLVDVHDWRGLDIRNENLPVTPFVDVFDAIDPSRVFFEDSLRNGVTTIHIIPGENLVVGGMSRVVKPIGITPYEMSVGESIAIKLSTTPKSGYGRMQQLSELREVFADLEDYLGGVAESRYEEVKKEKGEKVDVPPAEARILGRELIRDEDLDDKHRNLKRLTDGRLRCWVYCGEATDVAPALALLSEQGLEKDAVLVLGPSTHKAIQEIKASGLSVVLPGDLVHRERDPFTGETTETFLPSKFHRAGIDFVLQPSQSGAMTERLLTYQAARLVREGIPRSKALKAITQRPAELLGLGDRFGSIAVGRVANLVMYGGDPLDFNSWVEKVWIDGILAYDREKDPRIESLFPEAEATEVSEAVEEVEAQEDETQGEEAEASAEESSSEEARNDEDGR